jgi:hypothetical protein
MPNEEDYEPGPDDGIHDPGDYKPAYTSGAAGRVVVGEVAILRAEVQALRHQVAACEADNTALRRALLYARAVIRSYEANIQARPELVDAGFCQGVIYRHAIQDIRALAGDSPDESSGPQESRTSEADH